MNLEKLKVYCVLPAYNEEKTIIGVINEVAKKTDKVVVVDDCSFDKTSLLAKTNGVLVLKHIINRGQGAALRTGTDYAIKKGADIIIHFDADGQFLASDIDKFVEVLENGEADIVFGSRFLGGHKDLNNMPFIKRRLIMPLAKLVNKIFLGVKFTDPQSGFRAFNRQAAKKIKWEQDRMAHCSEIMIEAEKSGLRIKEVPIAVIYHDFGQKFSGGIKILKDLIVGALLK